MLKNISKYAWFSFIPFILAILLILYLLFTDIIPLYYLWCTLLGWVLISGLGIAVGYHRVFSHRTHSLPVWKENLILFFGALGGQGSAITWTAIHRGYHHRFSDTARDLHSPVNGIGHAFFGWTLDITENSGKINLKGAVDLLRKPNHLWFHKHQLKIQWAVPILVALFNWQLALMLIVLPTGVSILQDNIVNVMGHLPKYGYRNFDTNDNSSNFPLLGYLAWGQGWHNNHHFAPASYDFGNAVSGKWWEIDPCIIFNKFLR